MNIEKTLWRFCPSKIDDFLNRLCGSCIQSCFLITQKGVNKTYLTLQYAKHDISSEPLVPTVIFNLQSRFIVHLWSVKPLHLMTDSLWYLWGRECWLSSPNPWNKCYDITGTHTVITAEVLLIVESYHYKYSNIEL